MERTRVRIPLLVKVDCRTRAANKDQRVAKGQKVPRKRRGRNDCNLKYYRSQLCFY